jgi:hypothetical protein
MPGRGRAVATDHFIEGACTGLPLIDDDLIGELPHHGQAVVIRTYDTPV